MEGIKRVLNDVIVERRRQNDLEANGDIPWTCARLVGDVNKLAVLAEEFGEVSREVCENMQRMAGGKVSGSRDNLRTELVQTAAVCVAWVEAIDWAAKIQGIPEE